MNCFFKSFIQLSCVIAILAVVVNYASSSNLGLIFDGSWWRALRDEFIYSLQVINQHQNSAIR
ncbi:unnamed protein product [Debaryomyces tyrocola]|nr:unnamed protein product [Debaryomyces tyrocola]